MLPLHLGGLELRVHCADPAAISTLRGVFADFLAPSPDDLRVDLMLEIVPDLNLTDGGDSPPECATLRYQRPDLTLVMNDSRTGAEATVDGSPGALEAAVELMLQGALLTRGGFVVHGVGAVDAAGDGWLVPGRSGAGKSTLGRTAGFPRVLADEGVIVRQAPDGAFRMFGSPFWSEGRTRPIDAGTAPLRVLARPIKATSPRLDPWDTAEAAAYLLGCVMFHETSPTARALLFESVCAAAASAECVRLEFPKEGPWLNGVGPKRAEWARSSITR